MNERADRTTAHEVTARESRRRVGRIAFRISAIYLSVSVLWLVGSDWALTTIARATGDPMGVITRFQTIKGILFVFATTCLLYCLVRSYTLANQAVEADLQKKVQQIAHEYQLLFERNPLSMWVYDPQTLSILAANEHAITTYGYSREEFLTLKITDLRLPEDVPALMQLLENHPGTTASFYGPWTHRRKDGSLFSVEVVRKEIQFAGKDARLVMSLDVTDRIKAEKALDEYRSTLEKRVAERTHELSVANEKLRQEIEDRQKIEAELRTANRAAEEANEAKSVFLANTTHEIRTPLTSIMGYADLLLDRDVTPGQRDQYVTVLRQNASHLLKMIDDLLDLSRIETGNLRLTFDDYSPRDVAEQSLELLRPRAAEKGLGLSMEFLGAVPDHIWTDGVRLRQILINLLNNAIKFTHEGRVALVIRGNLDEAKPSSDKWLRFDVVDTGIGIEPQHLDRIFEPFYQVEQGETRRYGGTGLGLAISRRLAEQMGGSLEVTSQPQRGSVFTLRIPVLPPASVADRARAPQSEVRIAGRVLLAEDNANIRWLVEEYLRRAGASVVAVENGAKAVQAVTSDLAGTKEIDLVLMDISMPEMDGTEAMRRIREEGYTGPIVAMTAHSGAEEQGRWLKEGWDAVAGKPINRHTFIPLIAGLIAQRRQAATVGQ